VEDKSNELARRSIERLVADTFMHVEMLNNITKSHPELVIPIARRHIVWPGLTSRKLAFQKKNAELIKKIQLGKNYVLKGEFQPDSPSTHLAYLVHWWGTTMQKQWGLPKLTRRNSRKWFDQVWRGMLSVLHIVPEKDPYYAQLAQSAATPAIKRAEIKRKIKRTFAKVIRHK
jgi:hypothetical protein